MGFAPQATLTAPQAKIGAAPATAQAERARNPMGNQAMLRRLSSAPRGLQCKLEIGAIDDPLEREADEVADKVMRMPDPALAFSPALPQVRRKCAACEEEEEHKLRMKPAGGGAAPSAAVPAIVEEVLREPGRPLDPATRAFFEPRFGQDLSAVRVHTGARPNASVKSVNAAAYTVGPHIAFAAGGYAPDAREGRRLIAHELAHTIQQGAVSPIAQTSAGPRASASSAQRVQRGTLQGAPGSANPSPAASAAAPAVSALCSPIGAAAAAACTESNPMVIDASTGRLVFWSTYRRKPLPQVTEDQSNVVQATEKTRIQALSSAIMNIQFVQKAILTGQRRYPGDPSWDSYKTFFRAMHYMNIFWGDASGSLYFDYLNSADDKKRYENLGKTAEVLSHNLSFMLYPGRYLCDGSLGAGTGAAGTQDGIIIPPDWFKQGAGYKLLTLTHEYFHVMTNRLIDDYPSFRTGHICTFEEAINEPNCLSAFVAWAYTGQDEQRKAHGYQPCLPGQ